VALHPRLENALLIYENSGRAALSEIYDSYASIAIQADVPMAIFTPTWRANPERMAEARVGRNVNSDAVMFLKDLRESWDKEGRIFIGGLLGCKNDCYRPEAGLPAAAAQSFHRQQVRHLTEAGVDFLLAATLPSVPEARGIALSMESSGLPYLISFVIDRQGFVLDGNSLEYAFASIDTACRRPPLGYMINCAYPSFLQAHRLAPRTLSRLLGFQANASSIDQLDLDGSGRLKADAVDDWGDRMIELHRRYGLKILGGCCGTGPAHLSYLARELGFRKNG
jgi:S-methylmethionine-dependent homocysteine/selenocysteine methylase